jgi:Mitochondrial large subunit ribosomal protein (Img2)
MRSPFSFAGTTTRHYIHSRSLASNTTSGHPSSPHLQKYIVPRNSRGSLPVYSDVRNGGTRYLISIRNVEGNIKVCL